MHGTDITTRHYMSTETPLLLQVVRKLYLSSKSSSEGSGITFFATYGVSLKSPCIILPEFYVLLTVHLITIFVNNQPDAQLFFLYLFIPIHYMFRATKCSSSGESIVSIRPLVYVTVCRWPCCMHVYLHTARSPLSWWWALDCSKHVENWNKHI